DRLRTIDGRFVDSRVIESWAGELPRTDELRDQANAIRDWRLRNPQNATAALLDARYAIAYAVQARGAKPHGKLEARSPPLVVQYASNAKSALESVKTGAAGNPMWYALMLEVGALEAWPEARIAALLAEAAQAGADTVPVYLAAASSLMPDTGAPPAQYRR